MTAIAIKTVTVDKDIQGQHWVVNDIHALADMIAIISIGQAEHAATIIRELMPRTPAISRAQLFAEAKAQLNLTGKSEKVRYHRDGFLFECISWIAAQQKSDSRTFLKVPHIKATTQGMDGLIIQLHATRPEVVSTTICEDKCTENPRNKFTQQVLPTFSEHHQHKRSADLLATAVALIKESGLNGTGAMQAAERVLDMTYRTYRAALTVDSTFCTIEKRSNLFKGYADLDGLTQKQRIGATFLADPDLRDWFQKLADHVTTALTKFEGSHV